MIRLGKDGAERGVAEVRAINACKKGGLESSALMPQEGSQMFTQDFQTAMITYQDQRRRSSQLGETHSNEQIKFSRLASGC